jgi:MFS family permease
LEKAGLMISVLMVFTIIGQTVGGYLGDKIDKRLFLVFTMLGHSSGLLVLTFATNDFHVVMFCLLHGLAWGSRGPSMQSLRADYFGRRSFATIMGFSSILNALAMAIAPISAGVLADHYGDYTNAFVSLAIMTGCGSLFFALLKPPKIKKTTV